jgi:hypothetical protein
MAPAEVTAFCANFRNLSAADGEANDLRASSVARGLGRTPVSSDPRILSLACV